MIWDLNENGTITSNQFSLHKNKKVQFEKSWKNVIYKNENKNVILKFKHLYLYW